MISRQNIQWQFLKKCVELEKIPHALLFCGSDSAELKASALKFISLINNQDVGKGIQPDLFIIGPGEEKEIKIGQIRELRSKLSLKSYAAPFKAVIVEAAHQLNQEAQSAFLKLLEEPKGKTVFILITEYPEILLPTVLSRVERLRFYTTPLRPLAEIFSGDAFGNSQQQIRRIFSEQIKKNAKAYPNNQFFNFHHQR